MWLRTLFILAAVCFGKSLSAQEMDIAIIGGGVNGAYTAWKLKEGAPSLDIHLFEATDRIGGRLYTIFFPEMENVPVELGGMRFMDTHQRVHQLAKDLGLTVVPFIFGEPDNLYYLRGKRLHKGELKDPAKLPYQLAENERGKSASEILKGAVSELIPNFETLTSEQWDAIREIQIYEGKPLKNVSWLNFLAAKLSPEAFQYLADIGDISLSTNPNMLSQIDLLLNFHGSKVYKINEGYQQIPLRLAKEFQKLGGSVHQDHLLVQIRPSSSSKEYELIFENSLGVKTSYFTKKVILTISPTALLKLLPYTPLAGNLELQKNLKLVAPVILTKLFLAYEAPWWRQLNLREGNSQTSMPIRGCYYFPSEEDFASSAPENKRALLLASYQQLFTPLWRALAGGNTASPTSVNENMITQAQYDLKVLHGMDEIPPPYAAAFQDWEKAPYYGAFYYWMIGADPRQVDRDVRKPENTEEIYIFTSDFCEAQGWVECALSASDRLLEQYFPEVFSPRKEEKDK